MESLREAEKRTVVKKEKPSKGASNFQITKEQEKELRRLKNRLSRIETEISDLEKKIETLDLALAENYDKVSSQPDFFKDYKSKKAALNTLMEEWEEVEDKVSNF